MGGVDQAHDGCADGCSHDHPQAQEEEFDSDDEGKRIVYL